VARQFFRFGNAPEDDVCIQQQLQFQFCNTSQSLSSEAGEMTSPVILTVSFRQPSHALGFGGGGGGLTSATGSPLRVTRKGCPVFFTLSKSRRHVALNSEIVTFSIASIPCYIIHKIQTCGKSIMVDDYGQLNVERNIMKCEAKSNDWIDLILCIFN